jgi:hypothetical protein
MGIKRAPVPPTQPRNQLYPLSQPQLLVEALRMMSTAQPPTDPGVM